MSATLPQRPREMVQMCGWRAGDATRDRLKLLLAFQLHLFTVTVMLHDSTRACLRLYAVCFISFPTILTIAIPYFTLFALYRKLARKRDVLGVGARRVSMNVLMAVLQMQRLEVLQVINSAKLKRSLSVFFFLSSEWMLKNSQKTC